MGGSWRRSSAHAVTWSRLPRKPARPSGPGARIAIRSWSLTWSWLRARASIAERLFFLYGTEIGVLLQYGEQDPRWLEPLEEGVPALRGEVRLAVERGMALGLADVMDRRLALLLFSERGGWAGAPEAAEILRRLLG